MFYWLFFTKVSHFAPHNPTSYTFSEIISLKEFAIFMRKGKQYIMLTLYNILLEMMPWDNAFMYVSTHKKHSYFHVQC